MMTKYTVNSECGPGHYKAESVEEAKAAYSEATGYDFDDARDNEASWYYIDEDGETVESRRLENMP